MPERQPTCPICRSPTVTAFRPFCSRRCADVDLARWLGGVYAVTVGDHDDDEDGTMTAAPFDIPETGHNRH